MTSKNTYWVADADGTLAAVEGVDERDRWVRERGWAQADEPGRHDFVWVRHEDPALGAARMTWEAAQLPAWAGRGWTPGAPPQPGETAEPATTEPVDAPVEPVKTSSKPRAASGDDKE